MKKNILLAIIISLILFTCIKQINTADLVIRNAVLFSTEPSTEKQSLAIKNGKILKITSDKKISQYISKNTKVIDAEGNFVMPGFNDAHLHFTSGGLGLMELQLRDVKTPKEIARIVKQNVTKLTDGELIKGRGWDHENFPNKKMPEKEILDQVAPNNPVVLSRIDGHTIWVNSYVLEKSGINKNTKPPFGGSIIKNKKTGEPTGILQESACELINSEYLSGDNSYNRKKKAWLLALEKARQFGITSIQHLNDDHELIQNLMDEGQLTLRVTFNMQLSDDEKTLNQYLVLKQKYPPSNNWIRFGYLKGFIDGTLGSRTALMLEPYSDDNSTSGLAQMSYEELENKILTADKKGFQIGVHAIGTKGNRWILEAYKNASEINGKRDARHRSEHAQLLAHEDIAKFHSYSVIPSMQPTHCIMDKLFAEKRIGMKRCKTSYAWKDLLNNKAWVAFGTDWPVAPLDPFLGLYAAVTRKDIAGQPDGGWISDQKISITQAIKCYTEHAAFAEFMEGRKGKIKEGYLADIIILNKNLLKIEAKEILNTKVLYTIVNGKIVYQ